MPFLTPHSHADAPRKRATWWRALSMLALTLLLAPGLHARDMADIKASGKLVVAIPDQRNPPFFFEDHGELKGLDIDLAKSIGEALGVSVVFNRDGKNFNDAVRLVSEDKADMSAPRSAAPWRARRPCCSAPPTSPCRTPCWSTGCASPRYPAANPSAR
jgi:ABC-type amino acid transport substrate-binding protein